MGMLLNKVRKTIERQGLLKKGDKVLVACSGGADSTALLAVLLELREEYSLRLALGHLNHKLRRSARDDERFVIGLAQKYSLPLYLGRKDVRGHAKKRRLNIEEAGRTLRYEFLRRTASKVGATKIATGHTMTDQAETFLLRLLRGTGPRGLGGIAPILDGLIIRPLLEVEREEIDRYLRSAGILHRTDETNLDLRYLRNKVRLRLVPHLQKSFQPRIVRQLGRLAEIIREEDEFLDGITQDEMSRALAKKEETIFLDTRALSSLPRALARRCVRNFLVRLKGDLRRISFQDIEALLLLGEKREVHLPGRLVFRREKGFIFLKGPSEPPFRYDYAWDGKVKRPIPQLGLGFAGRIMRKRRNLAFRFDDNRRAYLDADKLLFPLSVRSRREGDRYRPLGAPGAKKLKEIMRAKEIPPGLRDRHPVFLSEGKIVWVLGLPVAEEFKVTAQTRNIFVTEKSQAK